MNRLPSLLTFSLALLLTLSCGKQGDKPNTNPPPEAGPTTPATLTEITAVSQAADRKSLNNRAVQFTRVTVQSVVGNFIFWAGPSGESIPIVRGDRLRGEKIEHVKEGEQVDIVGTVRTFDSLTPGEVYSGMWDHTITNDERTKIEAANVFIAADKVTVDR